MAQNNVKTSISEACDSSLSKCSSALTVALCDARAVGNHAIA